ncbi:ComEA family DNA-binding protein [Halomonas rhizosphaerae]|uniref:ComEA family DNA-binding protein n=1 Tax=Halomonas rhizosphaerae TaxID=3043296 RepID=UPI00398D2C61
MNTSRIETLQALPHIRPSRAQAIIDGHPWDHPEQLQRISGLGGERVNDIVLSDIACDL